MTLARHPNKAPDGMWRYLRQGGTLNATAFTAAGTDDSAGGVAVPASAAWLRMNQTAGAGQVWAHGFWSFDWSVGTACTIPMSVGTAHNDGSLRSSTEVVSLVLMVAWLLQGGQFR